MKILNHKKIFVKKIVYYLVKYHLIH